MEKLIYLLGEPTGESIEALDASLRGEIIPALLALGASRIRTCIRDAHVEPAQAKRMGEIAQQTSCYLSLWAPSRSLHSKISPLLSPLGSFLYGYTAAESEQLFHDFEADGSRVEGMNEVVCFRKPDDQNREEWLDTWLNSHGQIAIDTQSTFGYIQHIVGDILEPGSPRFDAFVEENFPAAAMNSDEAFYDAKGEELQQRMDGMIQSVIRFIDMESIQVMPMSEYNF